MMGVKMLSVLCGVILLWNGCSAALTNGYYVKNAQTGKCLAVNGPDQNYVISSNCDSSSAQLWNFYGNPTQFVHYASGLCVDIMWTNNVAFGTTLGLSPCTGEGDQQWFSESQYVTVSGVMTRVMHVKNAATGLCLVTESSQAQLGSCDFSQSSDTWWTPVAN